jgi:Fe-S-cluster containining protein
MTKKKQSNPRLAAASRRGADGRLHLALQRDPSGQPYLSLRVPVFDEAWQNEIAAGAANTVLGILRENPSLAGAVELGRRVMAATSRLAGGLLAHAEAGSVACAAGCDHCCHQSVGVTAPEAFAIVEHLKRSWSAAALESFAARIAQRVERTRGLTADQRFSPELPCPFLASGQCSIYEVRPLVCRGMNSLDAGECEQRLRDPEARARFVAEGRGGHTYLEPIRAAQAVSAGLQLGVSELYALDMRPLELTAALHVLLGSAADDATSAWLRGGKPLEAAVNAGAAVESRR